jgi:hypothetical protein
MTRMVSVTISRVSANIWILIPAKIWQLTRWIGYISGTFSGPSANCQRIEITVRLPSNGWKFGPAMRGNLSADNTLAVGFPRPLIMHLKRSYVFIHKAIFVIFVSYFNHFINTKWFVNINPRITQIHNQMTIFCIHNQGDLLQEFTIGIYMHENSI